ncbi:Glorund [Strongyloides ratti]|uniref:Glorund n=1 Tax=Strongyloides ratti TaxID=34506 RepID=A0A090MVE4_STRRB|nr:Glorund [Strongyloides ratti]CEF62858.1 Glorund [Strongyloides ratti]
MEDNINADRILRLRGYPYSATETDFIKFFEPLKIVNVIFPITSGKRPQGECYVVFENKDDAEKGLLKHKNTIGHRYIEIFKTDEVEVKNMESNNKAYEEQLNRGRYLLNEMKNCVKLRGLPFSVTKGDVKNFFKGLKVLEIIFEKDPRKGGRLTGEGMVSFATSDDVTAALNRDRQNIGSRYIEVFRGDFNQFIRMKEGKSTPQFTPPLRSGQGSFFNTNNDYGSFYRGSGGPSFFHGPYDRMTGRPGHIKNQTFSPQNSSGFCPQFRYSNDNSFFNNSYCTNINSSNNFEDGYHHQDIPGKLMNKNKLQLRGIPFSVNVKHLQEFFKPIHIESISMGYHENGKLTGDCIVEFEDSDSALEGMKKNGLHMGTRYIEIFNHENARLTKGAKYEIIYSDKNLSKNGSNVKTKRESSNEEANESLCTPVKRLISKLPNNKKRKYPTEIESREMPPFYNKPPCNNFYGQSISYGYYHKSPEYFFDSHKRTKYF